MQTLLLHYSAPDMVWALGAVHSLQFTKQIPVKKWQEFLVWSKNAQGKWLQQFVNRETTPGTKQVEDVETAIKQEPEDVKQAALMESMTRKT